MDRLYILLITLTSVSSWDYLLFVYRETCRNIMIYKIFNFTLPFGDKIVYMHLVGEPYYPNLLR